MAILRASSTRRSTSPSTLLAEVAQQRYQTGPNSYAEVNHISTLSIFETSILKCLYGETCCFALRRNFPSSNWTYAPEIVRDFSQSSLRCCGLGSAFHFYTWTSVSTSYSSSSSDSREKWAELHREYLHRKPPLQWRSPHSLTLDPRHPWNRTTIWGGECVHLYRRERELG